MADYDEKKARVMARLAAKNKERSTEVSCRLPEADFFESKFWVELEGLKQKLSSSRMENETKDNFDSVAKEIQALQKFLTESSQYLSAYGSRKAREALQQLQEQFQIVQGLCEPKRKFVFKSRQKPAQPKRQEKDTTSNFVSRSKTMPISSSFSCDSLVENLKNTSVTLKSEECTGKDVVVSDLVNCELTIFGFPNTLHLAKLESCIVKSFPVSTSIFVADCTKSTFVVACQQLRIHSASNCSVYLHVTSSAIVEDCTDIGVAPYNLQTTVELPQLFADAGVCYDRNNWDKLEDFNWLASDKPSPNWFIIPDEGRETYKLLGLTI